MNLPRKSEDREADNVGERGEDHRAPPPPKIRDRTRWDLHDIRHDLAESEEQPDLEEGESLL